MWASVIFKGHPQSLLKEYLHTQIAHGRAFIVLLKAPFISFIWPSGILKSCRICFPSSTVSLFSLYAKQWCKGEKRSLMITWCEMLPSGHGTDLLKLFKLSGSKELWVGRNPESGVAVLQRQPNHPGKIRSNFLKLSVIYLVFTTESADVWGAALLLLLSGCGSPRAVRLWMLGQRPGKLLLLFALQSNLRHFGEI